MGVGSWGTVTHLRYPAGTFENETNRAPNSPPKGRDERYGLPVHILRVRSSSVKTELRSSRLARIAVVDVLTLRRLLLLEAEIL